MRGRITLAVILSSAKDLHVPFSITRLNLYNSLVPYYVYILSSRSRNLYVGVTNNVVRRVAEHRQGLVPGFTSRYRIQRLVHVEPFEHPSAAIAREKQIKGWLRAKKIALIEEQNPAWEDLAAGWFLEPAKGTKAGADPSSRGSSG